MIRYIFLFLVLISFYGCNKPRTVLICGDHVCVNKDEAKQYFEENLSLEVKVINKKKSNNTDLVELNLKSNSEGDKQVNIFSRSNTKKKIIKLSNKEIKIKKKEHKDRKKLDIRKKKEVKKNKIINYNKKPKIKVLNAKNVNNDKKQIEDICTILEKCSIEEISKYLTKQGKKEKFPNINNRE